MMDGSQGMAEIERDYMGAALIPTGEVPVPFAVFRVELDDQTHTAKDARYVAASKEYCRAISRDVERVVGRSYLQVGAGDKEQWLADCHRAAVLGETVRGFGYDPLVRDWICYSFTPSAEEGCCVYAFMRMASDERTRSQLVTSADAKTSHFISDLLRELAAEQDYEKGMDTMMHMMSKIIHADRLAVFECGGTRTKVSFELCAEGVAPQQGLVFDVPRDMLAYWFRNVTADSVVLVPDVTVIEPVSTLLYKWCVDSHVTSLMAAPFFVEDEIVGFFGAYNYQLDTTIDLDRLFEAVATFIAARIENRQLIDSLRRASSHDVLTDLLNRRGAEDEISQLLADGADADHVLALIDLDDFKRVNDVYGHAAGDEALRAMTRTMREVFPEGSVLSRNGGDEFLVLLSGEGAGSASMLLASLAARGLNFDFEGVHHSLTLSVGYARYPAQASTMRELVAKADAALYAVKLAGKAGFGKYVEGMDGTYRERLGFSTRDILEGVPYPMLVTIADERGEVLFPNTSLARMLGYGSASALMRATRGLFPDIVHPDDRERVKATIASMTESDRPCDVVRYHFRALMRDGSTREVIGTSSLAQISDTGLVLYTLVKEPGVKPPEVR